jgi:hypothetical protein
MKRPERPQITQRSEGAWRGKCARQCRRQLASTRQPRVEALNPTRITVFSDSGAHVAILPGEATAREDVSVTRLCAQRFRYSR